MLKKFRGVPKIWHCKEVRKVTHGVEEFGELADVVNVAAVQHLKGS